MDCATNPLSRPGYGLIGADVPEVEGDYGKTALRSNCGVALFLSGDVGHAVAEVRLFMELFCSGAAKATASPRIDPLSARGLTSRGW